MIDNNKTRLFTEKNLLDLRNNILKNKMLLPVIKDHKHKPQMHEPQVPNIPGLDFVLARVALITERKIVFYDQYGYNIKRHNVPLFYSYSQYYFYLVETMREYFKKEKDFWESSCMPLFLKILLSEYHETFVSVLINTNKGFKKKLECFLEWYSMELDKPSTSLRPYMFDFALTIHLYVLYCLYGFKFNCEILKIMKIVAEEPNKEDLESLYIKTNEFLLEKYIKKSDQKFISEYMMTPNIQLFINKKKELFTSDILVPELNNNHIPQMPITFGLELALGELFKQEGVEKSIQKLLLQGVKNMDMISYLVNYLKSDVFKNIMEFKFKFKLIVSHEKILSVDEEDDEEKENVVRDLMDENDKHSFGNIFYFLGRLFQNCYVEYGNQINKECIDLLDPYGKNMIMGYLCSIEEKGDKRLWKASYIPLFLKILLSDCNEIFITTLLQANPLLDKKIEDFVHWFFNEMVAESMCPFRDYMFDLSLAAYLHVLYCLYGFKFDTNTLVIICHVASDLNINNLDAPYSVCKDFLYKKYILKKP